MFTLAKQTNSFPFLIKARLLRNQCTCLSRSLKKNYINNQLMLHSHNPKKMWQVLKPFYSDKVISSSIAKLKIDNNTITDTLSIVNHFNEHFISSIESLLNVFTSTPDSLPFINLQGVTFDQFKFLPINADHIRPMIARINKGSKSNYSLHPKILSHCTDIFSKLLCILINHFICLGSFPDSWKQADIAPKADHYIRHS